MMLSLVGTDDSLPFARARAMALKAMEENVHDGITTLAEDPQAPANPDQIVQPRAKARARQLVDLQSELQATNSMNEYFKMMVQTMHNNSMAHAQHLTLAAAAAGSSSSSSSHETRLPAPSHETRLQAPPPPSQTSGKTSPL